MTIDRRRLRGIAGFALLVSACSANPDSGITNSGVNPPLAGNPTARGVPIAGVTGTGSATGGATGAMAGMNSALAGVAAAVGTKAAGGGGASAGISGAPGVGGAGTGMLSDGGAAAGVAVATSGSAGSAAVGGGTGTPGDCTSLPPVTDYAALGPFTDVKMFSGVGPSNNYTLYRPDSSLGKDGFKHPVATWGNGILTTPDEYQKLLTLVASHGFVIIGCNDTQPERPCLSDGMDWLIKQNDADGPMKGKLDIDREIAIGYSWGGGAAIDVSDRPNVKVTASLHGMPPRVSDAFDKMHAPLLLTTSTGDMFVTASGYVTPNYQSSMVQTFYGTLVDPNAGHLYIADDDASICTLASALTSTFGTCEGAIQEKGPLVAWLRYWACDDQNAKQFFFGDDCTLCKTPWTMPQRKNWM
jgi:hypothetical protein